MLKKCGCEGCAYDPENIEEAKKITRFYIKSVPLLPYDCLANRERQAAIYLLDYIERLETEVQASRMTHNYDLNMIDNVKGEAVKLYKQIRELETERDYYKARYLEFNNVFIQDKDR